MAKSGGKGKKRPGLPAAASVVTEFPLAPPLPAAAAAAAAPGQVTYRVLRTNQMDEYEKPITAAAAVASAQAPPSDNYTGKDRKAAKLSISDAEVEEFDDLKDLIDSLPSEAEMKKLKIKRDPSSDRTEKEDRNVRVRAFIHAASREGDNDFHLIVGRGTGKSALYMTMEVSGLPPASRKSRPTLKEVRDAYKEFFGKQHDGLPGLSYDFYDPPVPVEIGGSLFFDVTHLSGGRPGPQDLRDDIPTIWEVHPVTHLVFEP
jgi:hypothetical protein